MLQNIFLERNFIWNTYFIINTSKENYAVQMESHYLNIIYNKLKWPNLQYLIKRKQEDS